MRDQGQSNRSNFFLVPNDPAAQAEAARLLKWKWSPRATELITRFPRRGREVHILTADEVERQLLEEYRAHFPAVVDLQRELGGVTYPTVGDDGDWATWGLTHIASPDIFEEGVEPTQFCCEYNTARPDSYSVSGDGRLWDEIPVARNAKIALERIAATSYLVKKYSGTGYGLVLRNIPLGRDAFLPILLKIADTLDWPLIPETEDEYASLWSGKGGWMEYSSSFQDGETLFCHIHSASLEEIERCCKEIEGVLRLPERDFKASRSFLHDFPGLHRVKSDVPEGKS
ncbi:hypothetical protein V3W47_09100 [Deinococcus sp. YIM 134068]|uniref:hypothetical protein n=1 Tax=Deinococcus lichenicola TaxID=3118910 RepID=UPI002F936FB7